MAAGSRALFVRKSSLHSSLENDQKRAAATTGAAENNFIEAPLNVRVTTPKDARKPILCSFPHKINDVGDVCGD